MIVKPSGLMSVDGYGREIDNTLVCDSTNNRFAVIDGDSALGPFSGAKAAEIMRRYLNDPTYLNDSLEAVICAANNAIRKEKIGKTIWVDYDESDKHIRNSCSVIAIQIRDDHLEFVQSGNCMLFVQYENGTIRCVTYDHKAKVQVKYHLKLKSSFHSLKKGLRRKYSEKKLQTCYENAVKLTETFQKKCLASSNTHKGYSSIDGSRQAISFLEKGSIPLMDIKKIALVSGGFQLLNHKTPGQERWGDTAKQIFKRGFKSAYTKIAVMERNDPYCLQYPRAERSDDKSGILLDVLRK